MRTGIVTLVFAVVFFVLGAFVTGCQTAGSTTQPSGLTPTDGLLFEQLALTADKAEIANLEASGKITGPAAATLAADMASVQADIAQGYADIAANGQASPATKAKLTADFLTLGIDEATAIK